MKQLNMKMITLNAMIAGVYAVLTIAIAPIAYGEIQMRISEVMVFLAFYNRKYIPGLVLGCLIANMMSPMGLWDMIFGTSATLLACMAMNYVHNLYLGAFAGALFNGIIVGAELYFVFQTPILLNMFYVFAGELAVLLVGALAFQWMEKKHVFVNKFLMES